MTQPSPPIRDQDPPQLSADKNCPSPAMSVPGTRAPNVVEAPKVPEAPKTPGMLTSLEICKWCQCAATPKILRLDLYIMIYV